MKREFSSAINRLRHPPEGSAPVTEIALDERHFPYFLRNREIRLKQATLILKPHEGEALDVENFDLRLNNTEGGDWVSFPTPEGLLRAKPFALGSPFDPAGVQWTIAVIQGELSQVEDIGILVDYTIQ